MGGHVHRNPHLNKIANFKELVEFYRDLSASKAKKFPDQRLKPAQGKSGELTLKEAINMGRE